MERLKNTAASLIVERRVVVLSVFFILTLVSALLISRVNVNYDFNEYLPDDSPTKIGAARLQEQFPPSATFNLMFRGLREIEKPAIAHWLASIPYVDNVSFEQGDERFERDGHTLYVITIGVDAFSPEGEAVVDAINEEFRGYDKVLSGPLTMPVNMIFIMVPAAIILLVVLFVMCKSWFEPVIFIISIMAAIILNMGTNVVFDSVSDVTVSIAAILQVVLCMDYSIMMFNRYRQEKALTEDRKAAMKSTLRKSFVTISSCSITTIVAMVMLVFMSFSLGMDLGLVLAKGVFLSLVCILTITPGLILIFDNVIEKTAKRAPQFKMEKLAAFAYSARYAIAAFFLVLFAASFLLRGSTLVTYTVGGYDEVYQVFPPDNPIVVLYENSDEANIAGLVGGWEENQHVESVLSVSTLMGAMARPAQFTAFISDDNAPALGGAMDQMREALAQFVGSEYSRLVINTNFTDESEEAFAFIQGISHDLAGALDGESFITGSLAFAYEMNNSFPSELAFITILTVISVFITVAVAFRSIVIPMILVSVIQCSIFVTMGSTFFQGMSIIYLALLIVQC